MPFAPIVAALAPKSCFESWFTNAAAALFGSTNAWPVGRRISDVKRPATNDPVELKVTCKIADSARVPLAEKSS